MKSTLMLRIVLTWMVCHWCCCHMHAGIWTNQCKMRIGIDLVRFRYEALYCLKSHVKSASLSPQVRNHVSQINWHFTHVLTPHQLIFCFHTSGYTLMKGHLSWLFWVNIDCRTFSLQFSVSYEKDTTKDGKEKHMIKLWPTRTIPNQNEPKLSFETGHC